MPTPKRPVIHPMIRAMNSNAFRSGTWARITGVSVRPAANSRGRSTMRPRICYRVMFDDGRIDYWPVEDAAAHEYEFRPSINDPIHAPSSL